MRDIPKGWKCPGDDCRKRVTADTLVRYQLGWMVADAGKWDVSGRCPHCGRSVVFTKHGAFVARGGAERTIPVPMHHTFTKRRAR